MEMTQKSSSSIRSVLDKYENKFKFPSGTLTGIYDVEARVVYMGRRRNVFKELKEIVQQVAESKDNQS